jgi:hypothetical protein
MVCGVLKGLGHATCEVGDISVFSIVDFQFADERVLFF